MQSEEDNIDDIDIEEKISATSHPQHHVAVRKFLEESCELAKALPANKRILFVLHYSSGFSIKEIAEVCKVCPETVARQLKRIINELNAMRHCMRDSEENGDVDKSTKERIAAYFHRADARRRSVRKSKNIAKVVR